MQGYYAAIFGPFPQHVRFGLDKLSRPGTGVGLPQPRPGAPQPAGGCNGVLCRRQR